jgi:hypothetical protein
MTTASDSQSDQLRKVVRKIPEYRNAAAYMIPEQAAIPKVHKTALRLCCKDSLNVSFGLE